MRSKALALLLCLYAPSAFAESPWGFGNTDGFGSPGFAQYTGPGPIANNLITPIFSSFQILSGTAAQFGGVGGGGNGVSNATNTSATLRRVPIPISGAISNVSSVLSSTTAGATLQSNINGVTGTLLCTYASSPFACTDTTHSDSVTAGDLFQWTMNPHGGTWAQTTPSQIGSLFTASSGQLGVILTGASSSGVGASTTQYLMLGGNGQSNSNESSVSVMFTVPGQILGLYVIPNAADTGTNQHTYTLCHNGPTACAATPQLSGGIWCADGADALGCCVNLTGTGNIGGVSGKACTTTTAMNIAAGDTLSLQIFCLASLPNTIGTCSTVTPGVGVIWAPSNKNQVPLFALGTNVGAAVFQGVADSNILPPATQTNYQLTPALTSPATLTISNYGSCTSVSPGGTFPTVSRTAALQFSTTIAAPTTAAGPTNTFGVGVACPGGLFPTGAFDTTHTLVAGANYTLDSAMTVTGGVAGSGFYKIGMAVTIP